jgi:hypothetical protein
MHLSPLAGRAMLLLGLAAVSCCGPHTVDPRPNIPVGETPPQSIMVENATGAKLVLLPRPGSPGTPPLTLAPGAKHELGFVLTDEENQSPNQEHELILNEAKSSPYFVQKDTDLQLRTRFAGETGEDPLRIEVGPCLLSPAAGNKKYPLRVTGPPDAGIPSLDLCPDD